jgi:16S rRNA (guanine527-N7)-methyltransferase
MTTGRKLTPADEFDQTLAARAADYGVALGGEEQAALRAYYGLVAAWNPRLHLVAPCAPSVFATRHVLESLSALPFLARGGTVVDIGSGAGLPAIPCLLVRRDLKVTMVEASAKKAVFLREAVARLGLRDSATVSADRFEKLAPPAADHLTCRAIERFTELLPDIIAWAGDVGTLLLFGGEGLGESLSRAPATFERILLPDSERRFLFVVRNRVGDRSADGRGRK